MAEVTERMAAAARAAYNNLPVQYQQDVLSFLQSNPSQFLLSPRDVVDAWLMWNGMIGYSDTIVHLVRSAFGDLKPGGNA